MSVHFMVGHSDTVHSSVSMSVCVCVCVCVITGIGQFRMYHRYSQLFMYYSAYTFKSLLWTPRHLSIKSATCSDVHRQEKERIPGF